MNETMKTILSRRSVREFSNKPIPNDILKSIIDAAMHAPSGMCKKTWQFTVITNRDTIKQLCSIISKVLDRPGYDMYNPTAIIIPSNSLDNPFGKEDNACALQNIFLAAKSFDIGSVWINQLSNKCDISEIRQFLKKINIPDNHVVYGLAALGYVNSNYKTNDYREIGVVNYIN